MIRPKRDRVWLTTLVAGLAATLTLAACTSGTTPSGVATPSATTPSPSPSVTQVSPGVEAARLVREGPKLFDAAYRLRGTGEGRDASVRVRIAGDRYRVDVTRGRATASLLTARAGLVSCQVTAKSSSCLLVAKNHERPPRLFDPGVQRLFRNVALIARSKHGVRVSRAGTWPAPRPYGPAQCFQATGKIPDPGVYCLLTEGRWAGALARAEFRSGSLSLRTIDARFDRSRAFDAPARPIPLPG